MPPMLCLQRSEGDVAPQVEEGPSSSKTKARHSHNQEVRVVQVTRPVCRQTKSFLLLLLAFTSHAERVLKRGNILTIKITMFCTHMGFY